MIELIIIICGLLTVYQFRMSRQARKNNLKRIQDEIERLEASNPSNESSQNSPE